MTTPPKNPDALASDVLAAYVADHDSDGYQFDGDDYDYELLKHAFEWFFSGNSFRLEALSQKPSGGDAAEWIKAQPHEDYGCLKCQFISLKSMINSMSEQLSFYRKKSYETGEKHLAELQASLESERAMNAQLTEELAALTPSPERSDIRKLLNEAVLLMGEPAEDGLHIMRAEAKIGKVLSLLGLLTPSPGYVMVPREPTREMINAVMLVSQAIDDTLRDVAKEVWYAMLDAAPEREGS